MDTKDEWWMVAWCCWQSYDNLWQTIFLCFILSGRKRSIIKLSAAKPNCCLHLCFLCKSYSSGKLMNYHLLKKLLHVNCYMLVKSFGRVVRLPEIHWPFRLLCGIWSARKLCPVETAWMLSQQQSWKEVGKK